MTPGGASQETTQLNIESLWAGGPFADPVGVFSLLSSRPSTHANLYLQTYNGGNKQPSEQVATAQAMQSIRQAIFQSSTGDIDSKSLNPNVGHF